MSAEITTVQIVQSDITQLTVGNSNVTTVNLQNEDITVLQNVSATINAATLSLSNNIPLDIARAGATGTSIVASREDHTHSVANTLLDGGNY